LIWLSTFASCRNFSSQIFRRDSHIDHSGGLPSFRKKAGLADEAGGTRRSIIGFSLELPTQNRTGDIMMRLATAAATMLLCSIASATAQPTPNPSESQTPSSSQSPTPSPSETPAPSSQSSEQQNCIFADSKYSEGAQFCVTSQQALKCENGRWSPVTMDCGGEQTHRHYGEGYEGHGYHGDEDHGYGGQDHGDGN
jgi:hypothetical protein